MKKSASPSPGTSLGALLVAASDKGVCAILLGDDPEKLLRDLQDRFTRARLVGGDAKFEKLVARWWGWWSAPGKGLDLPLDIRGTAFQQRVWKALTAIPAGKTASYARSPARSASPARCARWPRPAPPTTWRSPFPVTGW